MTIIRKIINWFKRLFQKLFKKKKTKNSKESYVIKNKKNKKYKFNNNTFEEEIPSYFIISNNEKEKLLYGLAIMKNFLQENSDKIREKEEKELISFIKNKSNKDIELKEDFLSLKEVESLVNNLDLEEKEVILDKYDNIIKREKDFKIHLNEIDKTIDLIKKNDISIMIENNIYQEISNIENDKQLMDNTCVKIDNFNKLVHSYINDADKLFIDKVIREYNKVNYVTVASVIIDNNYDNFKKLEDDFRNHRYNKYYYEREVNKIKQELNRIKNLKNKKEVNDHIINLRKELYTKSKDKYDLLYNNEVFMNFEKECDNLLDKLNTKVVDIKKEKVEVQEDNKIDEKNKYLQNILLRFEDLELARQLILFNQTRDNELLNKEDIGLYVDKIYEKFNNGQEVNFNFNRNKTKTELVILFNDINKVSSLITKEPYIMVEHINFKMDDLVEAVDIKNTELSSLLKINNIKVNEENTITDKLDLLQENSNKKKKNEHVLKKTNINKE
jgi:hypothetical protein